MNSIEMDLIKAVLATPAFQVEQPPENSTPSDVNPGNSTYVPHNFSPEHETPPPKPAHPHPVPILKSRSDSPLHHLSPADLDQLLLWLDSMTLEDVVKEAAKPRPHGLNLKTSKPALSRFNQKRALKQRIERAVEIIQDYQPPAEPASITPILEQLINAQILEDAAEGLDKSDFRHLTRYLSRLKDQEIRHRALDLHQKRLAQNAQRWGYSIVEETIRRLAEINEIVANRKLTLQERFHKAWVNIVGHEAAEMVRQANLKYAKNHPHTDPHDPKPNLKPLEQRDADEQSA